MAESVSLLPLLYILVLTSPLDPSFLALLVHWDIKSEIRSRNVFDVNWSTISCVLPKKKKKSMCAMLEFTWTFHCTENQRHAVQEEKRNYWNHQAPSRGWGGSSVGRAPDRHAADSGSIPHCGKGFFSQNQLSVQTLLRCPYTPCAIACINICAHFKDPVVGVRVQLIMETLIHPACTEGWVARPCRSWFSPGKATRLSHGRDPNGTIQ